jgi:hypothetical protein
MERETGIEPATNSLEGCDSTIELLPLFFAVNYLRCTTVCRDVPECATLHKICIRRERLRLSQHCWSMQVWHEARLDESYALIPLRHLASCQIEGSR